MLKHSRLCLIVCLAFSGCGITGSDLDTEDPDTHTTEQAATCAPAHDAAFSDASAWHGADVFGYSQNYLRGPRDCGAQRVSRSVAKSFGTGSCDLVADWSGTPIFWANELCARDPNMSFLNATITQACQEFFGGGSDLGDHDCRYIVHIGGAPYVPPFQPGNDTQCQPSHITHVAEQCPSTERTYVSTTGFSSTQGANQWSYLDGNGVAMVYDSTYAGGAWHSTTPANGDWCYISRTQQHPGNNTSTMDSIRRWTAPYSGTVSIIGNSRMSGPNGGDGAYVIVRKNGIQLFRGLVAPSDTTTGQSWSLIATVMTGDTIDTVVNRGGTYNNDEQILTQTISYQSQIQTYASTTGFSLVQGANQWSYLDGNGAAMIYDSTYAGGAWHSTTPANGDWCYISRTHQHPGNNTSTMDSIRRWTAPYDGTVSIIGNSRMSGPNGGDGTYVTVRKNGIQLFRGLVAPSDTTVGQSWSLTAAIMTGDTIDTVLNRNGTYNNDEQILTQSIAYQVVTGSFSFSAVSTSSALSNTTDQPIVLGANQTLIVGTCGVTGSSFSGDTYLRLSDSTGAQAEWSDDACNGLGSRLVHTATGTEAFTIRAGCYANTACSGTVAWTVQ